MGRLSTETWLLLTGSQWTHDTGGVAAFGQLMRAFRVRAGLSQHRLARRAGIDPAYVNRLERAPLDDVRAPSRRVVTSLAGVLELGPADGDRLLVAAGLCPEAVARLGTWEPTLGMVAAVLADPGLSDDDRADFRELVRIAAGRWASAHSALHLERAALHRERAAGG